MKHLVITLFALSAFISKATHNRSGEIQYKRIAPYFQTVGSSTVDVYWYSITVIKYHDNGPAVADRCVDTVYFGDGIKGIAMRANGTNTTNCCGSIPCGEIIYSSANYTIKKSIYTTTHQYPGPGVYIIRSSDPNRSGSNNIPNSVSQPFYIEAQVVITSYLGSNSSPALDCPPINIAQYLSCYENNVCAYDVDGDSLSFELTTCRGLNGATIPGYTFPSPGSGGTFSIHPTTGLLTWCSPQQAGMYNVAVIVKEWRKRYCDWPYELIGYVMRDMEIMVINAPSYSFSCTIPADTCISAGSTLIEKLVGSISNLNSIELYSSTNSMLPSGTLYSSSSFTFGFSWQSNGSHIRKQPHRMDIVFHLTPSDFKHFRQLNVTVVPPAPTVTLVNQTNAVTLNWYDLSANIPNLKGYYVYRKTGVNTWSYSPCENGVPQNSGFQFIGWTPSPASSFTDFNYNGLSNGTTANYIVTAMTNDCQESFASSIGTVALIVGLDKNLFLQEAVIYPNPFGGKIEVELNENYTGPVKTFIYSMDGRLVYSDERNNVDGKIQHELSELESGVYLLRISTDHGDLHRKLLKE